LPRLLSILLGGIALIAAVVGIRSLVSGGDPVARVQASTVPTLDKALPGNPEDHGGTVEFVRSKAEQRTLYLTLGGRSEAEIAPVAFGAAGKVTSLPIAEGAFVEAGALLCGLEGHGSAGRVKQAEAGVARAREAHQSNVSRLAEGWVSQARVKQSKAALDDAVAALEVARTEVAQRQAVAPFRGVFEKRNASLGEFVGMGSPCGVVVRLDPITFVSGASEKQALKIKVKAPARVKLPDGREVAGQVDKLASVVDPQTRNFEVKVSVPNRDNAIPVGRTAEVKINIGLGRAHKISQSLLKADSNGRIGVYYLDVGGVIGFAPADIVDESPDGVWVTGLSDEAQLVAEGQDNITTGLRVTPVVREALPGGG
jgi:membrane fusion protein, multidrug efflux system